MSCWNQCIGQYLFRYVPGLSIIKSCMLGVAVSYLVTTAICQLGFKYCERSGEWCIKMTVERF